MARELITSWGDYQTAIDRLLNIADKQIFIYDEDLGLLKLDATIRLNEIKRVLMAGPNDCIKIAVRDAQPLSRNNPQLLNLLSVYAHKATARQTPPELSHLRDNMILVDGKHGLIRFDREQARSKLLLDAPDELRPYYMRFDEIAQESGQILGSSTLGL